MIFGKVNEKDESKKQKQKQKLIYTLLTVMECFRKDQKVCVCILAQYMFRMNIKI